MLILMQNYGIFTKIIVLQESRSKETKEQEKVLKILKQEANNVATSQHMSRHN